MEKLGTSFLRFRSCSFAITRTTEPSSTPQPRTAAQVFTEAFLVYKRVSLFFPPRSWDIFSVSRLISIDVFLP